MTIIRDANREDDYVQPRRHQPIAQFSVTNRNGLNLVVEINDGIEHFYFTLDENDMRSLRDYINEKLEG